MKKAIFAILALLPSAFLHAEKLNQDNDVQLWLKGSIKKELLCWLAADFTSESRFGGNASIFYFTYVQGRLMFTLGEGVVIAPGFREEYFRLGSDAKWISTPVPMTDIIFKFKSGKWKFRDRNRIQYLLFDDLPKAWQYRNRLTILFPRKTGSSFNPLISEEVFFREGRGFFENRVEMGGFYTLDSWGETGLLYILRTREVEGKWLNFHNFRFRFDVAF